MLSRLMTRKEQLVLLAFAAAMTLGAASLYLHRNTVEGERATEAVESRPEPAPLEPAPSPEAPLAQAPVPAAPAVEAAVPLDGPVAPAEPTRELAVAVAGAILQPGLYHLSADARVQDLLDRAGGATEEADLSDINLAAPLIDGSTLTVPGRRAPVRDEGGTPILARPPRAANPPSYTLSGWRAAPAAAVSAPADAAAPTSGAAPAAAATSALIDLNRATLEQLETLPGIGPAFAQRIIDYRTQTPFRTVDELNNVYGIGEKRFAQIRPYVTVQP